MGKLLRVLTVFFFILSAVALALGIMLFNKRELLIGRTKQLESAVIEMASYIEDKAPEQQDVAFPERDVADVSPQILVDPQRADFWSSYEARLERQGLPTIQLAPRKNELMMYYKRDPVTLKVEPDEYGRPRTTGKGTMHDLLQEVIKKAEDQLGRLNATRKQLTDLREEYIRTVEELNSRKGNLREKLSDIVRLNGTISSLEGNVTRLQGQVQDLEAMKRDLDEQIAQQKKKIGEMQDEIADRDERIKQQNIEIKELRGIAQTSPGGVGGTLAYSRIVSQGEKGRVVSVNPKWKFLVLELNAAFMGEIAALKEHLAKRDVVGSLPMIELLVRKPGEDGKFVTKVRLVQLRTGENLAVADILPDWQQMPVEEGDVLFY